MVEARQWVRKKRVQGYLFKEIRHLLTDKYNWDYEEAIDLIREVRREEEANTEKAIDNPVIEQETAQPEQEFQYAVSNHINNTTDNKGMLNNSGEEENDTVIAIKEPKTRFVGVRIPYHLYKMLSGGKKTLSWHINNALMKTYGGQGGKEEGDTKQSYYNNPKE